MIPVQIATSASATSTPSDSGRSCARASADLEPSTIARSVLRQSDYPRRPHVAKSLVTHNSRAWAAPGPCCYSCADLAEPLLKLWPHLTPEQAASLLREQLGQGHTARVYGLVTAGVPANVQIWCRSEASCTDFVSISQLAPSSRQPPSRSPLGGSAALQGLDQVRPQIVHVLQADTEAQEPGRDPRPLPAGSGLKRRCDSAPDWWRLNQFQRRLDPGGLLGVGDIKGQQRSEGTDIPRPPGPPGPGSALD